MLVVVPKFLKSQNFKTTFQKNLTCIFLSLRANLVKQFALTDPVVKTMEQSKLLY